MFLKIPKLDYLKIPSSFLNNIAILLLLAFIIVFGVVYGTFGFVDFLATHLQIPTEMKPILAADIMIICGLLIASSMTVFLLATEKKN